jgi:hypothetical protein
MATYTQPPMSASPAAERFTAIPDDETLAETVVGLNAHGFSIEVVDDLDAARRAILARIPEGASVTTSPSVTDDGGPYDSARSSALGLDRATQLRELKAIMGRPEFSLGSVHAIRRDGTLVIASALGSQLASHAFGAAKVIFVVGAQKLAPDLAAAHQQIHEHWFELEDARALEAYGKNSRVGKILEILEIHQEDPGRIHVVLIQPRVGF